VGEGTNGDGLLWMAALDQANVHAPTAADTAPNDLMTRHRTGGTVAVARAVRSARQDGFVALDRGGLWPAYRRGGVEELEALLAALAGTALMRCAE
jgi:hypothetical protein